VASMCANFFTSHVDSQFIHLVTQIIKNINKNSPFKIVIFPNKILKNKNSNRLLFLENKTLEDIHLGFCFVLI
jgi:hypothetical protein